MKFASLLFARAIGALLAMLLSAAAHAATYPVDDHASTPYAGIGKMQWDAPTAKRGAASAATLTGRIAVQARLDVRPWKRRMGRIYLTLQNTPLGPLSTSWTTRGRLLPGSVRAGERTLVYAGPIDTDVLEDELLLTIKADGRRLVRIEQLNFSFEIDVN
ncbi:MAG TPA: hypothetical protein VGC55_12710 [Dokdonella sp.]